MINKIKIYHDFKVINIIYIFKSIQFYYTNFVIAISYKLQISHLLQMKQ